ncbi:zinc-binding dehydrogenase [Phycisphaera mikurensis]|uniref:Putative oxidoreductase n=1 Tax=Phycisphaera mikurensis (strain NBRC 102666 / KCTC 22515 / FYK2301M01) TaxID=1142394 RepID=I0IA81_PHYMF|nr:zinc-binding dehydrogenase [Phycisphaera mikurensis]MBB6441829.1 threonine dehydrogenase-like Zn-dependent dehydrogenase [Phycisphaera mikurensis]BAM02169.1 putative oxidoreductase [Phycisphaera mikurensis NBRC 102666]
MRLQAPGRFVAVAAADREAPGPGEVAVRVEGCGVCASNVPPWEGRDWFAYPFPAGAPGHEAWGVVEEAGPGVDALASGDRVVTLAQDAFAGRVRCAAADCVPLPGGVDGFPGEPVACAINVVARSGLSAAAPPEEVLVLGVGFLGVLLVELLAADGHRVTAASRRSTARDAAVRGGAAAAWAWEEAWAVADEVGAFEGEGRFSTVIECTGKQAGLDLATKLCRHRGTLVVAGFHQDGPRTVDMQLWNWRGLDVINAHERDPRRYREGLQQAVSAVAGGRVHPGRWITDRLPMTELDRALTLTRDRPEGFLKAVVSP